MITTFVWLNNWAYHSPHPREMCWQKKTHRGQRAKTKCVYCGKPATKRGWYYPCGTDNPPEPGINRMHEHCATAIILSGAKWGKYNTETEQTIEQHGKESN